MKNLITLCLLFTSAISVAQNSNNVQVQLQYISYSQGGVELPPEMMEPHPLVNYELILVKYNGPQQKPTIISSVKSDKNGLISLRLEDGEYGFISSKDELRNGVYLPGKPEEIDTADKKEQLFTGVETSDYWYFESGGPILINSTQLKSVVLTHYNVTICYLCP